MVVPFSHGTATSTMCAVPSLTNTKSGLYTLLPDLMAVSKCTANISSSLGPQQDLQSCYRVRVLWSSAPPLLATGFDDAEP
ncbi:hypothetical protein T08_11697 [Trichinella sp. T8]|nr:hypothetical protein T08_11697 [Trichinella sp. T8]